MSYPTTMREGLSIAPQQQQPQQPQQETRNYADTPVLSHEPGVVRAIFHADGRQEYRKEGVVRGDTSHMGQDASGVFTAMHTEQGVPLTMDKLQDNSIVEVPGWGKMKLQTAIYAGLVTRNAEGTYSKPGEVQQPAKREVHPDLRTEATDPQTTEAFEALSEMTSGTTQAMAIHEVVTSGDLSANTVGQLAADMGVEKHQMEEIVGTVREGFERQARHAVAASGVDPDTVLQWAYENRPREMQEAIKRHLGRQITDGYRSVAKDYVLNLDTIDPEAILNAQFGQGVTIRRAGVKIIVGTPMGEMTWQSAVRGGIIKLG